jgi:phage recombination protein Bet
MNNALATQEAPLPSAPSLVTKIAARYGVDANKLLTTLKATAFRQKPGVEITNEQMMALMVVADQYQLNPFTKEIYAFEDRGAIVPIVSVDGWSRIINSHSDLDGVEFRYSDAVTIPQGGKPCPEWCEAVIHHKGRSRPTVVREYLDEVYRPPFNGGRPGPWQTHTKRFLRHKALIQASRVAFGFCGIYDQDEGERIIEGTSARVQATSADVADLGAKLRERSQQITHEPQIVEVEVEPAEPAEPVAAESAEPMAWVCSECLVRNSDDEQACTACGAER